MPLSMPWRTRNGPARVVAVHSTTMHEGAAAWPAGRAAASRRRGAAGAGRPRHPAGRLRRRLPASTCSAHLLELGAGAPPEPGPRGTRGSTSSSWSWVPSATMRPFAEEDHPVGEGDGGRAVGDHDRGAVAHHLGERVADLVLLGGIDRRGGVVEDEHAGVGEDRPGDRDALALPAGQRVAPLADERVVPLGQRIDELVGTGQRGRPGRSRRAARPGRRRRCWRRSSRRTGTSPRTRCRPPCAARAAARRGRRPRRPRLARRSRRRTAG